MSFTPSPRKNRVWERHPPSQEEALKHLRLLQAALDVCGSAVMVVDPQGKVVAANSVAASLCGIES
ncbi:MAG TPA: hypothetical protein PLK67_07275, partial [Bryobacteraceae bacterium]|nr:hypothetical protein [Bryobacteraceae bacterium]